MKHFKSIWMLIVRLFSPTVKKQINVPFSSNMKVVKKRNNSLAHAMKNQNKRYATTKGFSLRIA